MITTAWSSLSLTEQSSKTPDEQNRSLQPEIPALIGPSYNSLMMLLQEASSSGMKEAILKPPSLAWHLREKPLLPDSQGQCVYETTPFVLMQVNAPQRQPPQQPKVRPLSAQSTIYCTDSWQKRPWLQIARWADTVSTVAKAQQAPQQPWKRIGPEYGYQSIRMPSSLESSRVFCYETGLDDWFGLSLFGYWLGDNVGEVNVSNLLGLPPFSIGPNVDPKDLPGSFDADLSTLLSGAPPKLLPKAASCPPSA